jgi:hypothetical protein
VILIASSIQAAWALVGNTYGAAKEVGVYITGEAIRDLLILKQGSVNDAQTLHLKQWLPASLNAPYGKIYRVWVNEDALIDTLGCFMRGRNPRSSPE